MINNDDRQIRQLLTWLTTGTKGGKNRAQIIKTLKEYPKNSNQLSIRLKVDYKTIRHHVTILEKNRLINAVGNHYSTAYFLSQFMEENYPFFEEITMQLNNSKKRTIKVAQK